MSECNESIKLFRCNICNKNYSSMSSLCNHNKKFHKIINVADSCGIAADCCSIVADSCGISADIYGIVNSAPKKYLCSFCNRIFNHRSNKFNHEKICKHKNKTEIINNNNKLEKEIIEIKKENIDIKNILKELIEKNCKIHPKTLQKINKQLINNNINNNNTNNTNNGTINNGPVINNTYVKFGNEQLASLLTRKDMLKIINKQCLCIEESIKTVHFNKSLPEYNNIFITNMKDTIAYIFDGSRFILTSKDEVINNLYNNHLENIEQFLDEAEIPENKYSKITKFLDILNDNEKCFIDGSNNNKKYSNYKAYKLIAIKNLIYNECDQKLLKKLNNMDLQEKINNKNESE